MQESESEQLGIEDQLNVTPIQEDESLQNAERELVEVQANYPGDWTILLHARLINPIMAEKMNAVFEQHRSSFKLGKPGMLDKDRNFIDYQERHALGFGERAQNILAKTDTSKATEVGSSPKALGAVSRKGQSYEARMNDATVMVFSDAVYEGKSLNARQKNIIESHEKGHAVREFSGGMAQEITSAINVDGITKKDAKIGYILQADEIIERMSQLKNYFGFAGDEVFTKAHLDYARENYIQDTGLDNNMSELFESITPEKEQEFLNVINKYPV